jgi:hypothetical protein
LDDNIPGIREPGVSFFGIVEPVGEPCEGCGERPGVPNRCPSDGRWHSHGMIHVHEGNDFPLRWLCRPCAKEVGS